MSCKLCSTVELNHCELVLTLLPVCISIYIPTFWLLIQCNIFLFPHFCSLTWVVSPGIGWTVFSFVFSSPTGYGSWGTFLGSRGDGEDVLACPPWWCREFQVSLSPWQPREIPIPLECEEAVWGVHLHELEITVSSTIGARMLLPS